MAVAKDPFYAVKEEVQESLENLRTTFKQWETAPTQTGEHVHLTRELLTGCESIEWQVDELDKSIDVAARDPAYYGLNEVELEKRRRWTSVAHNQVNTIRKALESRKESSTLFKSNGRNVRNELMKPPNEHSSPVGGSGNYINPDDDDFISSESDRQLLLIKQQDEELDELSASVQRIGGIGLTIHEELSGQERIVDELNMEMETTSNHLSFVQKKVDAVMRKAGSKGQFLMIVFLLVLFIILFILVFLT